MVGCEAARGRDWQNWPVINGASTLAGQDRSPLFSAGQQRPGDGFVINHKMFDHACLRNHSFIHPNSFIHFLSLIYLSSTRSGCPNNAQCISASIHFVPDFTASMIAWYSTLRFHDRMVLHAKVPLSHGTPR